MKASIHPKYFDSAHVVCACGHTFSVGSTKDSIRVEICSNCHPFFTGKMKYVDTLGMVEKFQKRQEEAKKYAPSLQAKKKKNQRIEETHQPKTLREMLLGIH